jgi:anti-anti-sigma factor
MITSNVEKEINISVLIESLNINNAESILLDLKKAVQSHTDKNVTVDLKQVHFVDSSAIAMLVNFVQHLSASRRKMSLINVSEHVMSTIKVLNLTTFLNVRQ